MGNYHSIPGITVPQNQVLGVKQDTESNS